LQTCRISLRSLAVLALILRDMNIFVSILCSERSLNSQVHCYQSGSLRDRKGILTCRPTHMLTQLRIILATFSIGNNMRIIFGIINIPNFEAVRSQLLVSSSLSAIETASSLSGTRKSCSCANFTKEIRSLLSSRFRRSELHSQYGSCVVT